MDRRDFFKRGISKLAQQAITKLENNINKRAMNWIRPPFAKSELDFLLACTRCLACVSACPHQSIFTLSSNNGVEVMNTPALDVIHGACHLCPEWFCVAACHDNALMFATIYFKNNKTIARENRILPKFATAVINSEICLPYRGPECGACASSCTVDGALNWTNERPSIDPGFCVGCAMCREQCISEPKAITMVKARS